MRTIIIIQAIIIVLGAYYLFTQSQEKVIVPTDQPAPVTEPVVREGYVPPTENPPSDITTDEPKPDSSVTGHSDVGMEYPTIDAAMEVR